MEYDPDAFITIHAAEGNFDMNRYNSALFTHLGEAAIYDHIFILSDEDDQFGTYIFRHNQAFEKIVDYMREEHFPMHRNMLEVSETDMDAFDTCIQREIDNDLEGL